MLSTKPVKNAAHAQSYFYEKDNYYFKDSPDAKELSQWYGKGAAQLGLSGCVEPAQFSELLNGRLPNGVQLGRKIGDEIQHRPGYDLTFSAPKSVSLLAYLGGDTRLLEAHTHAVYKALNYVERLCAQARLKKDGEMQFINTGNLIFATFLQDVSRALDPHLHTHCVTMNATLRNDGAWRALASNLNENGPAVEGFWERVRHYQRYLGMIYRAELAFSVKELGYSIEKKDKGFWEIKGVAENDLTFFSKRRQAIEAFMQQQGLTGARAASFATLATRAAKGNIDRETLHEHWQEFATSDFNALIQSSVSKEVTSKLEDTANEPLKSASFIMAKDAMQYAIEHLSATRQTINHIDVVNTALLMQGDDVLNVDSVIAAIDDAQRNKALIPLGNMHGNVAFTTPALIHYEQQTLNNVTLMTGNLKTLLSPQQLKTYFLQNETLNTAQKKVLTQTLLARDQLIAIEGAKNTNKEALYKPIEVLAKMGKHKVIVLSNTRNEAKLLQETYSLKNVQTAAHFIARTEHDVERLIKLDGRGILVLIDNAEKLSTKAMCSLSSLAIKTGFRLVPVFDEKAVLSVGHGAAISQMQRHGMNIVKIDTIANKILSSHSTSMTLADHITAALPKIKNNIVAIDNEENRFKATAAHYASLDLHAQNKTRVIMPSKAQCEKVNLLIHDHLKGQGQLTGKQEPFTVWLAKRMTPVEYTLARNYQVNQVVRFNETYRSLGIARGDYCRIQSINAKDNIVSLQTPRGITAWDPKKIAAPMQKIEVFEEKQREFLTGEKITATRAMKTKGIEPNEILTVKAVNAQQLIIINQKQKTITLDRQIAEFKHFDYAYAMTPQIKIGNNIENIIAHQPSSTRLSSQRQLYEWLGQEKSNIRIYTDNTDRYIAHIQKTSGDKDTLLDLILAKGSNLEFSSQNSTDRTVVISSLNERVHTAITTLIAKDRLGKKDARTVATEAVQYALSACAEREAAFTHKEILETALKQALGDASPSLIEEAVRMEEKNGGLIRGEFVSDGTRWTTPQAIARERFILEWAKSGEGNYQPISSSDHCEKYLASTQLRHDQRHAVRLILTTSDRLINIQGAPGTGKTTLLRAASDFVSQGNTVVQYLAPTHSAVRELNREGLNAMTLQQLLADSRNANAPQTPIKNDTQHRLFILDESSFTSNSQIKELFAAVEAVNGRVILVGDRKQNPAIEAGKPQTLLEWAGVKTAYLTDIQRQHEPVLLNAVKTAYFGGFSDSFKLLEQHIVDDHDLIKHSEEKGAPINDKDNDEKQALRRQMAVDHYFKQKDCLLMTLTNNDRQALNSLIRDELITHGVLTGKNVQAIILEPQHLTEVERSRVNNFKKEQLLRFSSANKSLGIDKGAYCPIVEIKPQQNICIIENSRGEKVAYRPKDYKEGSHSGIEVYANQNREVCEGDLIRFTRSNKTLGFKGGSSVSVTAINGETVTVKMDDGTFKTLDLRQRDHQHWDHAYAVTVHFAQGKTSTNVVALAQSYHLQLANQPNFIVMISRAVETATIITDDKNKLLRQILKNSGEKMSALEVTGAIKRPAVDPLNTQVAQNDRQKDRLTVTPNQQAATKNQPTVTPIVAEKPPSLYWDARWMSDKLAANAVSVLESLLGEPKAKSGHQYRYGSNQGSLFVTVSGDKSGWWKDFQTDQGGRTLLTLIQRETALDFKETLEYSAGLLGLNDSEKSLQLRDKVIVKQQAVVKNEVSDHQKKMTAIAQSIAKGLQDPHGTVVESYLRERGITENLPASIYFHPSVYIKKYDESFPAMVTKMCDAKGQVQAIHLTLLNEKTANKALVDSPKLKFGKTPEHVTIAMTNQPNSRVTLIAEGLETAMSVAEAWPHLDVKASLDKQNFKRIDPEKVADNVVLCLDNDLKNWREDKVITRSIERLIDAGKTVFVAHPESLNGNKTDYNDWLKHGGVQPIIDNISQAKTDHEPSNKSLGETVNLSPINAQQVQHFDQKDRQLDALCAQVSRENAEQKNNKLLFDRQDLRAAFDKTSTKLSDLELKKLMQNEQTMPQPMDKKPDFSTNKAVEIQHQFEHEL